MAFDYTRAPLKRARSFVWLVILCMLPACASGPKKPPVGTLEPDKFLWERGTEELNKKHWLTSREYFRQLMDSYPQSQYRADAKLGLADSYLGEQVRNRTCSRSMNIASSCRSTPHIAGDYAQYKLGDVPLLPDARPGSRSDRDEGGDRRADDVRAALLQYQPERCRRRGSTRRCSKTVAPASVKRAIG